MELRIISIIKDLNGKFYNDKGFTYSRRLITNKLYVIQH